MSSLGFCIRRLQFGWLTIVCLSNAPIALKAQDLAPRIGYVYPAGGQQDTTVEIVVGGQRLGGVTGAYLSGAGVRCELQSSESVPTGKEAQDLRDQLQKLREERKSDEETRNKIKEVRHRLALFEKSRVTPAIGETVRVNISIAPNAPLGNREFRLSTATGFTNPLVFQIGQYSEVRKPPPPEEDDFNRIRNSVANPILRITPGRTNRTLQTVSLPTTLNGQLLPGNVDRFQFLAKKGQKLVVVGNVRELIPYIADAVPGWVQLSVALYDSQGKELVAAEHSLLSIDPVLQYDIPADGDYVIEIKDAIFRGRDDFIYRVRVGEIPWVTAAFPLGGRTGKTTAIELEGWNLPTTTLSLDARFKKPGVYPLGVGTKDSRIQNSLQLEIGSLPEIIEKETNDSPELAQAVMLPIVINGQIDEPGDNDVYSFAGQAGETIVAEITARRLDSPLDSTLTLFDAKGRQLAFNDDHEDKGFGLLTHQADSYLSYKLSAACKYFLKVADAQQKGGRNYTYRLRISLPRPDFALRAVPSTLNFRPGATQSLTVYALRREGFDGDIELALKDAPAGFLLSGAVIPAGRDYGQCTLTAPTAISSTPIGLKLVGAAPIQRKRIEQPVVPAEDMMQAFFYRHLVPSEELLVNVQGRTTAGVQATIVDAIPLKIPTQGKVSVRIVTPDYSPAERGQLRLLEPPDGIRLKGATWGKLGVEITFEVNPAEIKPGTKGNLLVNFAVREPKRVPLGCLPAIAYEISGLPENNTR